MDFATAPFLHVAFMLIYFGIHEKRLIDAETCVSLMKDLILADFILFLPICYTTFKFIPGRLLEITYGLSD